jgi:hypothetical protein
MMLGDTRKLGVHHLIAFYLNGACRHKPSSTRRAIPRTPKYKMILPG